MFPIVKHFLLFHQKPREVNYESQLRKIGGLERKRNHGNSNPTRGVIHPNPKEKGENQEPNGKVENDFRKSGNVLRTLFVNPIHRAQSNQHINEMFHQVFERRSSLSSHQNRHKTIHRDQRESEHDERQKPDDFITFEMTKNVYVGEWIQITMPLLLF